MEKSLSRQLVEFARALRFDDLPQEVVVEIKRFLFDSLGCAFGGCGTKDARIMRDLYSEIGGAEEATIFGFGGRLPAANATLVNSLSVRALDFNDIYWREDPVHPSDLIPAALAVGEKVDAPMTEVIVAIALAYELEQRLALFAKPGIRERKWHHATLTQFASPVVAGRLLGLTEDQMVNAVGISGCHNHTIGCPTAGQLTMMKNTVDPMAVQAGVVAALMAQKGYTGTEAVFEGKEGFKDCFKDGWDDAALVGDLGVGFKIGECSMKAFPTEALTHTHISAALNLTARREFSLDQIAEVTVTTIARACDILFDPQKYRPRSRETADHSLPYCIAAALVWGEVTVGSFDAEKINDPRIWAVIDKIKGEASADFEEMFPAKQPSRVTVKTNDGKTYSEYLEFPKGDPRNPMTMEDLRVKFESLSAKMISRGRLEKIEEAVFSCEDMSCREFMEALSQERSQD